MRKYYLRIKILQIFISALLPTVFIYTSALATEYYVSTSSGNDNNSGTSLQPFQTIQHCANVAQAGDTCNISSGTYREQVTLGNSGSNGEPITFTAATGQTVIISGANVITGWTQYSGNIYVTNVGNITPPSQLYVDGNFYDMAHYPESGYLTATSNSSDTTSIIDSNLTLTSNQIVGATVMTRAVHWAISSNMATAYDNTTHQITLNGNVYSTQMMQAQYGFYLENMLWMLNYPGAWFYDSSSGNLYLWTTTGDNPNNHTVEISSRAYGISENWLNYITIQNLSIVNADQSDLNIYGGTNITLNNLKTSGSQIGIGFYGLTNSTVENNSVQNTLSDGMYSYGLTNVNVSNNTINNAGNVGEPKESQGGIVIGGINSSFDISSNTITNSGYNGIMFQGNSNTTVENNMIDKSCLVIDDCGGIYTNNINQTSGLTNIIISGNTITNSMGNFSGTADTLTEAEGIYLDDLSNGYTVTNNSVTNTDYGIFIHTGYNNTVTGNSVHSARQYGFLLIENNSGLSGEIAGAVHNNVITGNTFETIAGPTFGSWYGNGGSADYFSEFGSPIVNFGTFNNNQYCHPNISYTIETRDESTITNYTLSAWQLATAEDSSSTDSNSYCESQETLTLTASGAGSGTITSVPVGISCTSSCTGSFSPATSVTLTATANSGSVFGGWSGACSGTGSCTVTMSAAQNVTANFDVPLNLTVSTAGNGFGVVLGNGIDCGADDATECSETLNSGTVIALTAQPAEGYVFSGWSGACIGTDSCSVTMNAAQSVIAIFSSNPVNGVCGAADQTYLYNETSFGSNALCKAGTAEPITVVFPLPGSKVEWTCVGSNNGLNSSCKAQRNVRTIIRL